MTKHYCTHGTLLSSYCHECTTPEPTTAEATIERVRELTRDETLPNYWRRQLLQALEKQK